MIEYYLSLDSKVQGAIIGGLVSLMIFFSGWIFKIIYDRYSLSFKLKWEFQFEQKKSIKQEIAKTKTPLLNVSEELNYRLWNFIPNINENWHSIEEKKWIDEKHYYLRSFVYRLISFIFWILETEKSLTYFDSTIADKKDLDYIKYIKTFKNIFCDILLLKDLDYPNDATTNHFYKNDLPRYADYIRGENGEAIDFESFHNKLKDDYSKIKKVFLYINEIENEPENENLNVLRCFHLLLIKFLNEYGHDYQQTDKSKTENLIKDHYHSIKIKNAFEDFLIRNKLVREMKVVLKKLKSSN